MAGKEAQISLKLLVDTKANKVLFAEAGKEFVDFILHMMSLPLGTVVKLLNQKKMVGCLGDLHKSVESLNNQYFNSDLNKDLVLNPKTAVNVPLLSLNEAPAANTSPKKFYKCGYCGSFNSITEHRGAKCPNCSNQMTTEVKCVVVETAGSATSSSGGSGGSGYVKGVVTYMVMDNLEVKPMSTISGITLMNRFNIKDVSSLAEMEVQVGLKEVKYFLFMRACD